MAIEYHWCPACDSCYEGDEDKCSLCGAEIISCRYCGKRVQKTANFCPACRNRLSRPCPDCWIMGGEYDCGRKRCPWWLRLLNWFFGSKALRQNMEEVG